MRGNSILQVIHDFMTLLSERRNVPKHIHIVKRLGVRDLLELNLVTWWAPVRDRLLHSGASFLGDVSRPQMYTTGTPQQLYQSRR